MKLILVFSFFILNFSAFAIEDLRPLAPDAPTIREDFASILNTAGLSDSITLDYIPGDLNQAHILCEAENVRISVNGDHRWSQTFYMSLTRLGFLFPHPRTQVSPTMDQVRSHCGEIYTWNPAMKYHGFHFHTLHPNEWVHGFLLGKEKIANETIRWLARNQQNIFDLSLLRQADDTIFKNLKAPFALARKFGIHAGIAFGAALHQQNSFKLISLVRSFSDRFSVNQIRMRLPWILKNIDVSYIDVEMGTTEFTSTNYERTLKWLNTIADLADERGVRMLVKAHCSSNQNNPRWGNYNFLPQYANPKVGVLPHTVYLYGLNDEVAPMYGNQNFKHVLDFMKSQMGKRRTWYYPENSYFIALDIDIPLLLTDYLLTRADDSKTISELGVEGQLVFTTGHELGYWLFDWTTALLNNKDFQFDPKIGLRLLGEEDDSWDRVLSFQNKWFKEKGLLSILTFPNFGDEIIPGTHKILPRNFLKKLYRSPALLDGEISALEEAIKEIPSDLKIQNTELRAMWDVTEARIHHALFNRRALREPMMMNVHLDDAVRYRTLAQRKINQIRSRNSRYPEIPLFERHENPTAYHWGYAYPASNLHYWKREEEQIRRKNFSPFFMNITDFIDIIVKNSLGIE